MARPRLTSAITWARFENAVHAVLVEALRRLAMRKNLPNGEEALNLWLYWLAREAHAVIAQSASGTLPFTISFDARSQPEPDDHIGSPRLPKRPDFTCLLFNEQAPDHLLSQMTYYTECKRLGPPENGRVFNDLYSEEGMMRFMTSAHAYAKGCNSAAMVGYIQQMDPGAILIEVNQFATRRSVPSLRLAARSWLQRDVNRLLHEPLAREFNSSPIALTHYWIDIRHCIFDVPNDQVPAIALAVPPKQESKKSMVRKSSKKQT